MTMRSLIKGLFAVALAAYLGTPSVAQSEAADWSKEVLRTPDSRFEALPGYWFTPNYVTIEDERLGELRQHYIDVGPRSAPVVLMMHGEPTWSYLYRDMIKQVADAGYRVIAPDLIGFGRSDKPVAEEAFSYNQNVKWMHQFLEAMDLRDIVLFAQDQGGLIGLRLVGEKPDKFAGVIIANSFLPSDRLMDRPAFREWLEYSQSLDYLPTGEWVQSATQKDLPEDIQAAYDAPFPDERYQAGARALPTFVVISPDMPAAAENRAAWETLRTYDKPFLTAFTNADPYFSGLDRVLQERIPGTKGQPHVVLNGAHFLQEDLAPELSEIIIDFMDRLKEDG